MWLPAKRKRRWRMHETQWHTRCAVALLFVFEESLQFCRTHHDLLEHGRRLRHTRPDATPATTLSVNTTKPSSPCCIPSRTMRQQISKQNQTQQTFPWITLKIKTGEYSNTTPNDYSCPYTINKLYFHERKCIRTCRIQMVNATVDPHIWILSIMKAIITTIMINKTGRNAIYTTHFQSSYKIVSHAFT